LLLDEALHADFVFSTMVGSHALLLYPIRLENR
jgi:hypothetical protein